ncbi:hypothetical protein Tco_1421396 [Tanacetum coccineum]
MRESRRDDHASQIYMSDDTPMCDPMEAKYVQGYHGGYHNQDVMPNHVGDKELNSIEGVGNRVLTKKDDMGMPKENNKEWKLNEKAVPHNKEVYDYLWHPTEIPHLNHIIKES